MSQTPNLNWYEPPDDFSDEEIEDAEERDEADEDDAADRRRDAVIEDGYGD